MSNYPITEKFLMMEATHEFQNYDLPQFWNFIEDCCNELEIPAPLPEERGKTSIRRIMAAYTVKKG